MNRRDSNDHHVKLYEMELVLLQDFRPFSHEIWKDQTRTALTNLCIEVILIYYGYGHRFQREAEVQWGSDQIDCCHMMIYAHF